MRSKWRTFLSSFINIRVRKMKSFVTSYPPTVLKCETERWDLLLPFGHSNFWQMATYFVVICFFAIAISDVNELSPRVRHIEKSLTCEIVITHHLQRRQALTKSSSHFQNLCRIQVFPRAWMRTKVATTPFLPLTDTSALESSFLPLPDVCRLSDRR